MKVERTRLKTSAAAIHPATVAGTVAPAPTAAALSLCSLNQHNIYYHMKYQCKYIPKSRYETAIAHMRRAFTTYKVYSTYSRPLPDSKRLVNSDKDICFHSTQSDVRQVHLLK